MAKYANTKQLKKAVPTVDKTTGWVTKWELEVVLTHTREDQTTWSRTYSHEESDLDYLQKTPTQFTATELLSMFSSNLDTIFDAHYEAHNVEPTTERNTSFSLSDLA